MNKAQQYADGVAPAFTRMSLRELSELSLYKTVINFISALFGRKSIYYINGADSLPPPLDREVEDEYLILAAAGDKKAKEELITHNLRLVVYIAKKFESTGIYIEDLISIGSIGLIKAVNTFQPDKNIKLATYASRCIENEILMYLRKTSNRKLEVSLDEPLNVDYDGNELLLSDILGSEPDVVNSVIESEDERHILNSIVASLSERERQITCMRYGLLGEKEHTQKEVADKLGISQSYISRLEKRIIENIKNKFPKI